MKNFKGNTLVRNFVKNSILNSINGFESIIILKLREPCRFTPLLISYLRDL